MIFKKAFENEKRTVRAQIEAQSLLRELAAPAVPGERVAAAIRRAARRAGLSVTRASSLWYGNARAILADEMDHLRAVAGARGAKNEFAEEHDEIGRRLDAIEANLAALVRGMASAEIDASGEEADEEIRALRRSGSRLLAKGVGNRAVVGRRA